MQTAAQRHTPLDPVTMQDLATATPDDRRASGAALPLLYAAGQGLGSAAVTLAQ